MQRCVYAIPNGSLFQTDEIMKLEKEAEESCIAPAVFWKKLQVGLFLYLCKDVHKYIFPLYLLFSLFPFFTVISCFL